MNDNSESEDNSISAAAKKILKDGKLLETTEALALKASNNYHFAKRIIREYALIVAGQTIKYLDTGQLNRAYSHAGIYAPPGLGKDYAWKIINSSGIFPTDIIRIRRLEKITEAALIGTIDESTVVPPPSITEDIVFIGEYATLVRTMNAESIAADMRAMLENGEFSRRLAKIGRVRDMLETMPESSTSRYLRKQLDILKDKGLTIDFERCEIRIKTTTSWIIASAKFGSETQYGRSLISMGDINRYRWITYLPNRAERVRITSEIGSLPPTDTNVEEKNVCREAWTQLMRSLRTSASIGIVVPRDEQSYHARQKIWDETYRLMIETYGNTVLTNDEYIEQIVNLRMIAEFTRLMYQHATLKQFARNQGYDFSLPHKFIVDYEEDGEYAKQLWIEEYVPSIIDLISDLRQSIAMKASAQETLTMKGKNIVHERLKKGLAKREELVKLCREAGISTYLLDNSILRPLVDHRIIKRDSFGTYSLVTIANQ